MVINPATQIGDPVIRAKAKPVIASGLTSKPVKIIVKNLIDSMRFHGLVGMAAPQIGIGLRIFVTELRETKVRQGDNDGVRVFINPVISRLSKKKVYGGEGCGSVAYANLFGNVKRPESLVVTAYNEKGKKFSFAAKGLLARVIQHETDHLNGMVFLDRLDDMKSLMTRER